MNKQVETWVSIKDTDKEVSDHGRVRTVSESTTRVLKPFQRCGHPSVNIKGVTSYVSRLVANAFLPPPKAGEVICHLDGDRLNNSAWNLTYTDKATAWQTAIAFRHGTKAQLSARLMSVWAAMRTRCLNANCPHYKDYGGRGITVCSRWNEFKLFRDWALSNGYQAGLQLDRIDNDGNYEPGNCRFVTKLENMRNTRLTPKITAFGESKNASSWAEDIRCKVCYDTLMSRLSRGVTPELAISMPAGKLRKESRKSNQVDQTGQTCQKCHATDMKEAA